MSKPKVEIPAWQRAARPQSSAAAADDPADSTAPPAEHVPEAAEPHDEVDDKVDVDAEAEPETETALAPPRQQSAFGGGDVDAFRQQNRPPPPPPPPPQQKAAPIITYPEFLVDAHKPPPLITPARVLHTLYAAGGLATLVYAASKYLVSPMVDQLSDARHDFLAHSQSRVDELNDRLAQLVSQQPGAKPATSDAEGDSDIVTSDPTELYHRDMGTQTEAPPAPKSLISTADEKKDHVEWATTGLKIMESHIAEMANASDQAGEAHKDRVEKMNNLRHYLDQLLYGTAGGPLWTEHAIQNAYGGVATNGDTKKEDDAIDELKKEIRRVKGVLLSAKRFPPVGRPVQAAS